jgi:hypothetical protein
MLLFVLFMLSFELTANNLICATPPAIAHVFPLSYVVQSIQNQFLQGSLFSKHVISRAGITIENFHIYQHQTSSSY